MPLIVPSKSTCSEPACDRKVVARGLCSKHYQRLASSPGFVPASKRDPEVRFWEKVDKNGPIPEYAPHLGPCWIWTAALALGYGRFNNGEGRSVGAHRAAYEYLVGPIPDGLHIDHLCRVTSCVNPSHLEPVTVGENNRRSTNPAGLKCRQTHCIYGHEFTEANTYYRKDRPGNRHCRACGNAASAAQRARRRANLMAGEP